MISHNVIRLPQKRTTKPRSKAAYLTADQLLAVLRTAKSRGPREHAMFLFAFAHGARASEICDLRLEDLNMPQGTVRIRRLKGSLDSTQNFCKRKGQPLLDEEKAFKAWLAVRPSDSDQFVFNSRESDRLHRATIFRLFRSICESAGIPESLRHPHVLKHSLAMTLVEGGVNAFLIRQQLGHRSFSSTLAYVNSSDQAAGREAAKAFAKIF